MRSLIGHVMMLPRATLEFIKLFVYNPIFTLLWVAAGSGLWFLASRIFDYKMNPWLLGLGYFFITNIFYYIYSTLLVKIGDEIDDSGC